MPATADYRQPAAEAITIVSQDEVLKAQTVDPAIQKSWPPSKQTMPPNTHQFSLSKIDFCTARSKMLSN
uniref:Uncharacterized protein n=1 Tax=Romanomermis culicivorax TaxID=13658 RepID=A0A915JVD7_ROMCU